MALTVHELSTCYPVARARGLGGLGSGDWTTINEGNVAQLAFGEARRHGAQMSGGACANLGFALAGAAKLMLRASQRNHDAQRRFGTNSDSARVSGREATVAFNHWNDLNSRMERCERDQGKRSWVMWRAGSLGADGSRRVFYLVGGQYVGDAHQAGILADPQGYVIDLSGNPVRRATVIAGPERDAPAAPAPAPPAPASSTDLAIRAAETSSPYQVRGTWRESMLRFLARDAADSRVIQAVTGATPEQIRQATTAPVIPVREKELTQAQVAQRAAISAREWAQQEDQAGGSWWSGIPNWFFGVTDPAQRYWTGSAPTPGDVEAERRAGYTDAEIQARAAARAGRDPAVAAESRRLEAERQRLAATARADLDRQERERAAREARERAEAEGRRDALARIRAAQDRLRAQQASKPAVTAPARVAPAPSKPLPLAPPALRMQAQQQLAIQGGPPSWLLPVVGVATAGILAWAGYRVLSR